MPSFFGIEILNKNIAVITSDVRYPQTNYLAHSKPRAINHVQNSFVLDVGGIIDNGPHFVFAEDVGKIFASLGPRDVVVFPWQFQRVFVITLYGIDQLILLLAAYVVLVDQIKNITFNLLLGHLSVFGPFKVLEKLRQVALIVTDGCRAETF